LQILDVPENGIVDKFKRVFLEVEIDTCLEKYLFFFIKVVHGFLHFAKMDSKTLGRLA